MVPQSCRSAHVLARDLAASQKRLPAEGVPGKPMIVFLAMADGRCLAKPVDRLPDDRSTREARGTD